MSLRLEMLQVARLAPKVLEDSAQLVREFLLRQFNGNGGFTDRTGRSLRISTTRSLASMGWWRFRLSCRWKKFDPTCAASAMESIWISSTSVLARVLASAGLQNENHCQTILQRIEQFRSRDGGFNPQPQPGARDGLRVFSGLWSLSDLGRELPDALRVVQCLKVLETEDGAWANDRCGKFGSTNATAAAVALLRNLSMPINRSVGDWLLARHHPQGGFVAAPGAPMPDLLSTATALHALAGMDIPLEAVREDCLDLSIRSGRTRALSMATGAMNTPIPNTLSTRCWPWGT